MPACRSRVGPWIPTVDGGGTVGLKTLRPDSRAENAADTGAWERLTRPPGEREQRGRAARHYTGHTISGR